MLVGLSDAADGRPDVVAVDLNPLIVVDGTPVAVDALVEVRCVSATPTSSSARCSSRKGVIVAGASTHPGKFGFVALHNLLACGLPRDGLRHEPRGRQPCSASTPWPTIDDLPDGEADLVFVCTPAAANLDLLRGVRGARACGPRS